MGDGARPEGRGRPDRERRYRHLAGAATAFPVGKATLARTIAPRPSSDARVVSAALDAGRDPEAAVVAPPGGPLGLASAFPQSILNHMVQHLRVALDARFAALSDATRRGVLEELGRADASITELADKFHMTLTGMKKHVGVLEQAGLVTTEKVGRVRTCRLGPGRLQDEAAWIERYRQLWDARFDALDSVIDDLKRKEMIDGPDEASDTVPTKNRTTVERKSERELVVTRTFDAPGAPRVRGLDHDPSC